MAGDPTTPRARAWLPEHALPARGRPGQAGGLPRGAARARRFLALDARAARFPQHCERLMAQALREAGDDLSGVTGLQLREQLEVRSRQQALRSGSLWGVEGAALAWSACLERALAPAFAERSRAVAAQLGAAALQAAGIEPGCRLHDLARAARNEPGVAQALSEDSTEPFSLTRLPDGSSFRAHFEVFLDEFGHWTSDPKDPRARTWREEPRFLLEQLSVLLGHPSAEDPRAAALAAYTRALALVRRELGGWRAGWALWLAERFRRALAARAHRASALAAIRLPLRAALLESGRRMAAHGLIEEAGVIFDLPLADVKRWLRGEWDGRDARELLERPEVGMASGPSWNQQVPWAVAAPPGAVPGVGVSPGRVTAPCRIVRDASDGARLLPGEVLLAPAASLGWSPIVARAGAVAVESGGAWSSAALLAREFALPAVAGAAGLLAAATDGQTVTVDGTQGWVRPQAQE
ncbi:MAG: hypothetical protein HYY25_05010 [Candidatus Wallbacteria bacterium]|nr:hypothetical protein [Candidatus Wallbacteria bacterium]